MKQLKVKPAYLAAGLQKVLRAKAANSFIPAIECVHAKTFKGGLILTCTDLETTITTGIAAETDAAGIEFLIPPQVYTVINLLRAEETDIIITVDKKELSFTIGDNVMKFAPEDKSNFPKTPEHESKSVEFNLEDNSTLFKVLNDCMKFASQDDLRPAMTGIYFTEKELAATDGHRLLKAKFKSPVAAKQKFVAIVPKSFIRSLDILDITTKFEISGSYISVNDNSTKIISRVIDAKYPDYNVVIPEDSPYQIHINAGEVKRNIRIASTLTAKDKRIIFNFNPKKTSYTLKGIDIDLSQEIVLNGQCEVATVMGSDKFKGLHIAFNGAMLTQLLDVAAAADIVFEVKDNGRALIVNEDIYTLVLMPLLMTDAEAEAAKEQQAAEATGKKKVEVATVEYLN